MTDATLPEAVAPEGISAQYVPGADGTRLALDILLPQRRRAQRSQPSLS